MFRRTSDQVRPVITIAHMGVSQNEGYLFGDPHYNILGSIFWKATTWRVVGSKAHLKILQLRRPSVEKLPWRLLAPMRKSRKIP